MEVPGSSLNSGKLFFNVFSEPFAIVDCSIRVF